MDMNQEFGLNFSNPGVDEFVEKSPIIRMLVKKYVESKGSGNERLSVDQIMDIMTVAIGSKTFYVFLAEKDGRGVGLMTAHAVNHNDTKLGAMIHIGVVDEKLSNSESEATIKEAMDRLSDWANSNEMSSVFAQTMRSERPFDKLLLKYGWKRITTVYEKEITDERRKKDSTGVSEPSRVDGAGV